MSAAHEDNTMGIPNLDLLFGGYAVLIAGGILTLFVAYIFILAKMSIAALLAIGPIFIFFITFESTKKFFDQWAGQIMTFIFTIVLTSVVLKLIVFSIQGYLVKTNSLVANPDTYPTIDQIVPIIIFSAIATMLLRQVSSMASALGGGIAISTLGGFGAAAQKIANTAGGSKIPVPKRGGGGNTTNSVQNTSNPVRTAQLPSPLDKLKKR